jgi:hypothetical protein
MKNLLKLAVVALVAISMNACKNTDTAASVAEKYLNAMEKKEYKEAKVLCTAESQKMFDMLEQMPAGESKEKAAVISDVKCTETDSIAVCTYKKDGTEETLDLVKRNSKWLVNQPKESPKMPTEDQMMGDSSTVKGDSTK